MIVWSFFRFFVIFLRKWWIFLFGSLVILASTWPVLHPSFFRVHDFTQAARLGEMHRALVDGQFPVRWSQNFGFGYGMPLFNFYGPLPYYVASLPMFLGISVISSLKLLLLLINFWSFLGAFQLGKKLFGISGGLLVATVFVLFPYRAVDMYARGAWNELSAISFFPWVLYTILLVADNRKWKYILGLAVTLFGVLSSHNLMTLMFLPLAYAWGIYWIAKSKKKRDIFARLYAGFLLAGGLSAFYVLPAFLEKGFTQVDTTILGGYFDYHNHFLYIRQWFTGAWGWGGSSYGPEDGLSFSLGILTIFFAFIGSVGWYTRRRSQRNLLYFILGTSFIALFLTIHKSSWIWEQIPIMEYFQFPWRFLSIVTLSVALLAGGTMYWFRQKPLRIIASGLCCFLMIGSQVTHFRPESFLPMSVAEYEAREKNAPGSVAQGLIDEKTGQPDLTLGMYYSDPKRIQTIVSYTLPDYIPIAVKSLPAPSAELLFVPDDLLNTPIQIQKNTSTEKIATVSLRQAGTVTWRVNAFPGWTSFVDGAIVTPRETKEGWQEVFLTEGDHTLRLVFLDTPIRRLANIITLVSFSILGGVVFHARRSRN